MGRKICFITGTRADYGILAPVMKEIAKSPEAELQIIATNMHLSPDFGMTVKEIEQDGFKIDARIECLVSGGTSESTVLSMARLQEGLTEVLPELSPDMVVILGDRYEALAAASAAVVFNIPVVHLHGGETSEGAIDDKFRHAITQLSDLHFAATPQYAERILSMGKSPETVYHSGAPGAEPELPSQSSPANEEEEIEWWRDFEAEKFYAKTGLNPHEPFILLAFHPVTRLPDKGISELKATLEALDSFINQGYKILVTMPNSDPGNREIRSILEEWGGVSAKCKEPGDECQVPSAKCQVRSAKSQEPSAESKVKLVESLGSAMFHYAMDHALAMVGNSSAALIEAPSYRLGAVNVGIRQKGRAHGVTVMDAKGNKSEIEQALKAVLSMEMKAVLMGMHVSSLNPYYKENSASFIAEKLINYK